MRKFAIVFIYLLIFVVPLFPHLQFSHRFCYCGFEPGFVPAGDIVDFLFGLFAISAFVSTRPITFSGL